MRQAATRTCTTLRRLVARLWSSFIAQKTPSGTRPHTRGSMSIDKKLWDSWKGALRSQTKLSGIDTSDPKVIQFSMTSDDGNQWNLPLRTHKMFALGCDIVGYSRRSMEGQLYLTTSLFVAMEVATQALRNIGWLPTNEPRAVLPTGDGALIVTTELQHAFCLALALNMLVEDLNRGPFGGVQSTVESAQPARILPCEVRYALATGRLVEILDVTGRTNFIGDALVTCARILAASKGAHLLLEEAVIAEFLAHGGLNEIAQLGAPWGWGQAFHSARLQPRSVKTGQFTFFNVFGFYDNAAFVKAVGSSSEFSNTPRRYAIGSHDVTAIL